MTVILAWRNLTHDTVRLVITLTGVVFAVVLITLQIGLLLGFIQTLCAVIDHTRADIWIAARGTPNYEQALPIEERWLHRALTTPGVRDAERLVSGWAIWKKPAGGQESVIAVGIDLDTRTLVPWNIVSGSLDSLRAPDTVIVDRLFLQKLGVSGVGDSAEINGYRARIVGVTDGIRSFTTSPFVFTSRKNALNYARLREDQVNYILIHTEPGAAPAEVRDRLRATLRDVDVLTTPEFRSKTWRNWVFSTGAGGSLLTGAALGLVVGIVVVAQTLYASTVDHLNEFATLRAMGADNGFLYRIIALQAVMSAVAGYTLGMAIGLAIVKASERGLTAIMLSPQLAVVMFGITVSMCVLAAITSIRRVTRIEPAMVFKA